MENILFHNFFTNNTLEKIKTQKDERERLTI